MPYVIPWLAAERRAIWRPPGGGGDDAVVFELRALAPEERAAVEAAAEGLGRTDRSDEDRGRDLSILLDAIAGHVVAWHGMEDAAGRPVPCEPAITRELCLVYRGLTGVLLAELRRTPGGASGPGSALAQPGPTSIVGTSMATAPNAGTSTVGSAGDAATSS